MVSKKVPATCWDFFFQLKYRERARLVVQVKQLRYAASRLIGALRFARGFKKVPATYEDFEFFFTNTPDFQT